MINHRRMVFERKIKEEKKMKREVNKEFPKFVPWESVDYHGVSIVSAPKIMQSGWYSFVVVWFGNACPHEGVSFGDWKDKAWWEAHRVLIQYG